ncbi:MAG TPA: efflux RND transporter periplasmic adaptor subunit [Candidatus Acidoferrales bacterium]|nr:efflux RND transporter periplasmic adaptor subunit [Candidatus Acidoferrales bacterium]
MNQTKKVIRGNLIVIAAISAVLGGCSNEHRAEASAPETLRDAEMVVVQRTTVPDWLEVVGTVHAAQSSHESSQMVGQILEIRVHEGDRVQAGQVLATIDDAQPRAAVDQANASVTAAENQLSAADSELALAQATLTRFEQLYEKKPISAQEFEEIKTRCESAAARRNSARAGLAQANAILAQARTSLEYTRIRAPFSGIVTEKLVDAGTLSSPGMSIFTIEDTRHFRLEVTVDESEIGSIRIGQPVPVMLDVMGTSQLSGRIAQIVPAIEPASRSFLVKLELPPNTRIRSGLFGRAHFQRGQRFALLIPRAAVVTRGQLEGVYVVDSNHTAELRYVTLGQSAGEKVEVLSGLQDGDTIVAAPQGRELGGKKVASRP